MNFRIVAALLTAAAVAFACGPRSHSSASVVEHPQHHKHGAKAPLFASSLDVTVDREVSFALKVTNVAEKRLELTFPSGQTHEIVVFDTTGRPVWRWSEGRLFTQALQNRVVGSDDSVTFEERWSPEGLHGTFTAVATLRAANFPVEQRTEFTLP
jgi:hypothetical protein